MNIKWDADKYTENFSFVHQYGKDVVELIDCKNGSTLIDLGCGNGALTKALQEKGFRVTGVDSSEELLEIAGRKYPDIPFIRADAADFSVDEAVDVVFSNAVFHWIDREKQSAMLGCVYKALKEEGQFVFEFGGHGNNALIHGVLGEVFSEHGYEYKMPFYFPSIGEYAALVEREGFLLLYNKIERIDFSIRSDAVLYYLFSCDCGIIVFLFFKILNNSIKLIIFKRFNGFF